MVSVYIYLNIIHLYACVCLFFCDVSMFPLCLSPRLHIARAIEQIRMPWRILLNHIFDVVRLLRLTKPFARQKIIQLRRKMRCESIGGWLRYRWCWQRRGRGVSRGGGEWRDGVARRWLIKGNTHIPARNREEKHR